MFLNPKFAIEKSKARIESRLKNRGLKAELVLTSIARRGGEASFQRKAG